MKTKMSLVALMAFLSFIFPTISQAVECPGITATLQPRGYVQITVSSSAVPLTSVTGRMAIIMVEDNAIRYRDDGTDPSSTVGTLVQANVGVVVCGRAMTTLKAVRATGADAKISVHYYGD